MTEQEKDVVIQELTKRLAELAKQSFIVFTDQHCGIAKHILDEDLSVLFNEYQKAKKTLETVKLLG